MVSYLSVVFCAVGLIGILLQSVHAAEQQQLAEPEADFNSDNFYDEEKRGGGRAFAPSGLKRAGGRAFNFYNAYGMDKRGGGRGFNFNDAADKRGGGRAFNFMDKRGGGRAFYGYGSLYPSYPLVYKKALSSDSYVPYYLQSEYKRGGARAWSSIN